MNALLEANTYQQGIVNHSTEEKYKAETEKEFAEPTSTRNAIQVQHKEHLWRKKV